MGVGVLADVAPGHEVAGSRWMVAGASPVA